MYRAFIALMCTRELFRDQDLRFCEEEPHLAKPDGEKASYKIISKR